MTMLKISWVNKVKNTVVLTFGRKSATVLQKYCKTVWLRGYRHLFRSSNGENVL